MLGAAALVLALGGCGRKSGLDLPPSAKTPTPAYQNDTTATPAPAEGQFNPLGPLDVAPQEQKPTAPRGPNKRIILDPILD